MYIHQRLLALAAVLAASVGASSIGSPSVNSRAENFLDAPERSRLDLAYQEAVFRLGADKVGRKIKLGEDTAEPNWSVECIFTPYILIQPESADDVSVAIRIIDNYNIKFATYGGGHAPHPGFAGITNGALIHLGRLNHTSVSDDRKIASVGPGGRWGHVVNALAEHDVYVSGGRVPIVGVGGVLLGGGLHHTQPEFGIAADNLHNIEIVLSDGSIVNANGKENKDLFWALKGGGANFGIVTRFDLRALPIKDVWYQWGFYPIENRAEIFEAFVKWQLEYSDDVKATVGFITTLTEINIYMIYTSHDVPAKAFGPLIDIEPTSWLLPPTNGTFGTLNNELWGFAGPGQRHEGGTASFLPDTQTYLDVFDYWYKKATVVHETTGANISWVLQPISHNAAKVGEANGGNPLNIAPVDHTWWTSSADWDNAEDDDTVRAVTIDTFNYWDKVTKERGLYLPLKFMNDCSRVQNPLASYGKKNLKKLKEVAAKYDRSGFFQKKQNNGFLVSKA